MYTQHPLSAAWPAMSESDFQALKDSIENIGVQMPVVIFEGQVIDGWNRFRAAGELGMVCPTIAFDEAIDPVDFVKAMNDARRHITGSQRAIAIVAIHAWRPAAVKGGGEPGSPPLSKTNKEMAEEAGVSERSIQQAKAAQTAGLADKVKSGEMTVKQAENVAKGKPAKPAKKTAPAKKERPAPAEAPEPTPDQNAQDNYTELDAARDKISELKSALVVANMGDVDEEGRQQAAEFIANLQAEIKTLIASLAAAYLSRDTYMEENAQLKKQCQMQRREIDRLKTGK
jgi:hypothetical protein